MRLRRALVDLDIHVTELLRILILQVFLVPAARWLPKSWALALAEALSLSLFIFPIPGRETYRHMRRRFGESPYRSFQLAWEWIARPFLDFVILQRVLYGREDVLSWKIIERNAEEVTHLRKTGQSFIVATGHFERAALAAMSSPQITPGNLIQVGHAPPRQLDRPYDLRLRIQYGTLLKILSTGWRRRFEFAATNTGQSPARLLYERLSRPGSIVNIHVDAPWPQSATGSFCRPFAGMKNRSFSTGAAQLAKLCRCPIVSCVYWRENDGTVFLQWGSPVLPVEDEIDTMNRLIDTLEVAVGDRPTQYMLDIGHERRWNPALRRWEDLIA